MHVMCIYIYVQCIHNEIKIVCGVYIYIYVYIIYVYIVIYIYIYYIYIGSVLSIEVKIKVVNCRNSSTKLIIDNIH